MTVSRLVRVNLAAAVVGLVLYLAWCETRAHWLVWGAVAIGFITIALVMPLVIRAGRVASVGPIATAGVAAALVTEAVSRLVALHRGGTSLHQAELDLLTTVIEIPWFVIFGLRLRRSRVGKTALLIVVLTLAGIAARPITSSDVVPWATFIGAFAAYVLWLVQLPGALRPGDRPAGRRRAGRGRLWFVPGAPSTGWIAAQIGWLLIVAVFVAVLLSEPRDHVADLLAACFLWLIGAWILAAASYGLRAIRGRRRARVALP